MTGNSFNTSADDASVRMLYKNLLHAWNMADAAGFAGHFHENGFIIGFDGSHVQGRSAIQKYLAGIFAKHKTGTYVSIIRSILPISSDVFAVHAVAGIVPAGKTTIQPDINAEQTAVVKKDGDALRLMLFQNTPAAYHGRPEAVSELTAALEKELMLSGQAF